MDPSIRAWVQVMPEKPTGNGKLAGIPFGAKDIIETRGLATEYGSPIYKGRIGIEDAAIIREIRQRGGILLGKTVTTAFAYRTPGPTRAIVKEFGTHTRRKLKRIGRRGSSRHGSVYDRRTDPGVGGTARLLLRRHRIQDQLRFTVHGRCVAAWRRRLGITLAAESLHEDTPAGSMLALLSESMGHLIRPCGGFCVLRWRPWFEPLPEVEPAMQKAFRNAHLVPLGEAPSVSVRLRRYLPECSQNSPWRAGR